MRCPADLLVFDMSMRVLLFDDIRVWLPWSKTQGKVGVLVTRSIHELPVAPARPATRAVDVRLWLVANRLQVGGLFTTWASIKASAAAATLGYVGRWGRRSCE